MIMRVLLATAIALVLATSPAEAGPTAQEWAVDRAGSQLGFTGAMNGKAFSGVFRRWAAIIRFDPKNLVASSVMTDVDTASAVTGDQRRDEALPTPDWFASLAFPRATFRSRQFRDLGGGRYIARGVFTIRNIPRTVDLPFTLKFAGRWVEMHGELACTEVDQRRGAVENRVPTKTGTAVAGYGSLADIFIVTHTSTSRPLRRIIKHSSDLSAPQKRALVQSKPTAWMRP